jgi:hypothetical protein
MWAGDGNDSKSTRYNGLNNDKEIILTDVGPTQPNTILYKAYKKSDYNMNGQVKYNNTGNDKNFMLDMIMNSSNGTGLPAATQNTVLSSHITN